VQLLRAALGAFAPAGTLADLDAKVAYPFQTFKGRPEKGHYVELLDGVRKGQRGVIVEDDKTANPYKVKLSDGATTGWLKPMRLASSGLDEAACRVQMARVDAARLPALDGAVQALRDEERAAVTQVRERVGQDRLPLLSLLQVEPLQMQSAHLSFQECFAAQAICSGKYRFPEGSPPPWQWPAFWANAVTLGSEMGDAFGKGLKQTAGVGDVLDLSKKLIGGDRPTMVAAVAQLMRVLASLSLRENGLTDGEGVKMLEALQANTRLRQLSLNGNKLGDASGCALAVVLKTNTTLTQLSLNGNKLGDASGCALAVVLKTNTTLTQLSLNGNKLGDASGCALAVALQANMTLRQLDLGGNELGAESVKAMGEALQANTTLTQLNLNGNKLGDASGCALAVVLQANTTLRQLDLGGNELGAESGKGMVEALKTNTTFRTVMLDGAVLSIAELTLLKNRFDVETATMLAKIGEERGIMLSGMKRDQTEAKFERQRLLPADAILIGTDLQFMAILTTLSLWSNSIGDEGAIAIAQALKVNAVMTTLHLGLNQIGAEGAIAIAEALKVNAVVTTLILNSNRIGTEGAITIAEALKVNAVVTELGLNANNIGPEGAIAIAEALKVNAVLTKLNLEYNSMGDAGKKAVRDAVKDRSGFVLEL
jgi:Ran GTPase-activating protein (RanGAP) involved in mRNA processing and transport